MEIVVLFLSKGNIPGNIMIDKCEHYDAKCRQK